MSEQGTSRNSYLDSFLNMENSADPRLLRLVSCCSGADLVRTDLVTEGVDEGRRVSLKTDGLADVVELSAGTEGLAEARVDLAGCDRFLVCTWSFDVREGAEVKPVDWVSCE